MSGASILSATARKRPPPPRERLGLGRWLRANFFATPVDAALTMIGLLLVVYLAPTVLRWAVIDSVAIADGPAACRAAAGACWAIIHEHAKLIFFGLYPRAELWRPGAALAVFVAAVAATGWLGLWRIRPVLIVWAIAATAFIGLMGGGWFGLTPISADRWGGLPLTLYVFMGSVGIGFPIAVALALGRASSLPAISWVCTAVIELARAVPLLTILFCAAVVAPLLVPGWFNPDKLNRVILSLALFYACYQAEVIRGGFQGVASGQIEAARALGLDRIKVMWLVVLPQALRITIPATVNLLVVAFKDTSMVIVVGLFDFLASANKSFTSDAWAPFFGEVYILVSLVFLAGTGTLAWFGKSFERRLARHA